MTAPTRWLMIGIDAASPQLLRRWTADGSLPNLRRLIDRGISGSTRNVDGFFIGSTWPSLQTGLTPAGHGIHYLAQLKTGSYDFYWPADEGLTRTDPFWTQLGRAGRRVAVLDVPLSRLEPDLDGIQTVEWGSHDSVYGFQASTAELREEILSRWGEHPVRPPCDAERRTADDYRLFLTALTDGVAAKTELTRHFLSQGGWDLFMQVFTESHCAGHQCWHLHDAAHPAHDPEVASAVGDPLRTVYSEIDAAIGEIVADAGDARILVLSAHGMSHWYGAQFLLSEILFRLGVAVPTEEPDRRDPTPIAAARAVWRRLPAGVRDGLRPLRDRIAPAGRSEPRLPTIGVDSGRSRCFIHPNGLAVGGIRLNLKGREPAGVLEPGADAEAFCAELERDLLEIVDERTGGPLIRRVLRTAELYAGPYLDGLPDLLVEWSDETPTGSTAVAGGVAAGVRARSAKIGVVMGENRYGRTGEHRPEGLFIAAGPGIAPGRPETPVSILDFAPTIAAGLGVTLPVCDGRIVEALA